MLVIFRNPEFPGLKHRQSRDSGLRKWAGIPIGIPTSDAIPKGFHRKTFGVRAAGQTVVMTETGRLNRSLGCAYFLLFYLLFLMPICLEKTCVIDVGLIAKHSKQV